VREKKPDLEPCFLIIPIIISPVLGLFTNYSPLWQ
jgi:hypothetical protein